MLELGDQLRTWCKEATPFALATVVAVRGSAPRPPGATMAVHPDGQVIGSVSGGCVEGAIYELASSLLSAGTATLATYGISDDEAFSVGLTCGGILDVLVTPIDARSGGAARAGDRFASGRRARGAGHDDQWRGGRCPDGRLAGPHCRVRSGDPGLDAHVAEDVRGHARPGPERHAPLRRPRASHGGRTARCSYSPSPRPLT